MAALTVEPRGLRLCLGETAQLMLQNCGSGRLAFKILTTGTAACSVRPNEGFLEARSNAHVRVTLREQPPGLRLQVRAVASCAADAAVAAAFDRAADVAKLVVAVDYAAHDTAAADEPTDALCVAAAARDSASRGCV
ncbi:hypothetical protein M885DRAFT_150750 [Pelagophyceae sp. CCMP2097]|nr:hypothetical protein M885DRAFT_150750 [Pelagophyceae sp. CCMP2097]